MRFAVIGTFYRRRENSRGIVEALYRQTRHADEHWLMCETDLDAEALMDACYRMEWTPPGLRLVTLPTPRDTDAYAVIPYSHKINWVLDRSEAEAIVYLDNGSLPMSGKFGSMADALEAHPEWGAVYVGQHRTGFDDAYIPAHKVIEDAYCILNFTQVMHRRTADRWELDMAWAKPTDLADARFWRALHASLGPFYPVGEGVLDEHHIPDHMAAGV